MKVRDLMSYPIATVRPEDTVLTAVKRMAGEKKGSVLVARDCLLKQCLGIVTTSQIFRRVFAEGRDPAAVSVQDIMTAGPLVSIDLDASTAEAARLMREHNMILLRELLAHFSRRRQTQNLNSLKSMIQSSRGCLAW
ncbi:MAG: CBS domain-containing protein [Methanothrix sp.]|nr:CBS domain-containing protein [Methanothrix sp.]